MVRRTRSKEPGHKASPNYVDDDSSTAGLDDGAESGAPASDGEHFEGTGDESSPPRGGGKRDDLRQDGTRFEALEKEVANLVKMIKMRRRSGKRSPKKTVRGQKHREAEKRKKRRRSSRPTRPAAETDDSEDEWYDDEEASADESDEEEIPRIEFDIEALTGKPPKHSKNKSRTKYKYPRPYMYQLRPTLFAIKDRECFDHLSYEEYVFGMVKLISTLYKKDDRVRCLLDHLLMVAEDAIKFSWEGVREFTNSCFDKVDRKEMTWRSRELIRDERIKLAWISGPKQKKDPRPCHLFNTATCDKDDGHIEGDAPLKHRCMVCWYGANLKECTHSLHTCNKKALIQKPQGNSGSYAPQGGAGSYKHNQYKSKAGSSGKDQREQGGDKPPPKN